MNTMVYPEKTVEPQYFAEESKSPEIKPKASKKGKASIKKYLDHNQ